jgi:outer membrane cobalamin receptor
MTKKLLLTLVILLNVALNAQQNTAVISGIVTSEGKPTSGILVYADKTTYTAETNEAGKYEMKVPAGTYTVIFSNINYKAQSVTVTVKANEKKEQNITIIPATNQLDEIAIEGKTAIQKVRETPYNVVALDAKSVYNTTLDLAHLLNRASGVRLRENGGVGSDMSISLNGFTGRQIKLFMDGVPMEGFGSAFQLNNIPVGIADRIEVYKGVVPVEFGADALGGAINIVTNQRANTYVDASYSYGSFNTRKSNINLGYTAKSGFTFQMNAFQNYSDNNYKVFIDEIMDVTDGTYSIKNKWVRRFHDTYHNETVMLKTGFVKKSWADRFLVGVTLGQEYADIQTANMMKIVFGKKSREANSNIYSLNYEKRNLFAQGLSFRLTANYNTSKNSNHDVANRQYNWFGDYRETGTMGESALNTLAIFRDNNYSSTANIGYIINEKSSISVNDVISGFERKNEQNVTSAELGVTYNNMRRINQKNVLGLSYRYRFNEKLNLDLFGKNYNQRVVGPVDTGDAGHPNFIEVTKNYNTSGYGIATTYFLKDIQLKASAEKAFRLPTERELFGDEALETGNASIRAENSNNLNLGFTLNKQVDKNNSIYADVNGFYRYTSDYIQRLTEQRAGSGGSINHGKVQNMGVDAELRYYYKNRFAIGGNVTVQDPRNKERYRATSSGILVESTSYNIRMYNTQYFFGNADATYYVHDFFGKGNILTAGYAMNFIDRIFLNWENLATADRKQQIPQQFSHDLNLTFSSAGGRYNIAFEARNITNELLYDNYALQKPGRSFSVKLRYFFMKK